MWIGTKDNTEFINTDVVERFSLLPLESAGSAVERGVAWALKAHLPSGEMAVLSLHAEWQEAVEALDEVIRKVSRPGHS